MSEALGENDAPTARRKAPPRARNQGVAPPTWIQERVEYAGYMLARLLIAPLGPRGRSAVAGWAGRVFGARLPAARKRIDAHLDLVRPETSPAERRRIRRGVVENFTRTAVEYVDLPTLAAEAGAIEIEGLAHLEAAKAEAGGRMIVVSAHYGNWEAVRAAAAHHDAPLAIIYRAFNNRLVDDSWFKLITAAGWPAFRKGGDGAKGLFRHVRGGGGALVLVDQRLGGAPLLDFMGQPAETSLAAAQLARTLKAPLLPAMARRVRDARGERFVVRFEPAVPHDAPDAMMQRVNDVITQWIDEEPAQWFWLHRRWKVRGARRRARKFESGGEALKARPET